MAEKKKKKKQQVRGMPKTDVQSRIPPKTAKGKPGKVGVGARKFGTGIVGQLAKRRAERIQEGKWVVGEKLTKRGQQRAKARKEARATTRRGKKAIKAGERIKAGKAAKGTGILSTKKSRVKAIGAKKGTVVQRKAVKAVKTKGGDYVKYEKKSKAAKGFRSAFKSGCAGGAKSFSWDGRSYSCAKAGPKKAKKPITRGGEGGQSPE